MFNFFKKIFLMAATGYMLTAFTAVYAQQNAPAGNADPEFKRIEALADETAQLLAEKVNRFEGVIISYKGEKMVEVYGENMNAQKLHHLLHHQRRDFVRRRIRHSGGAVQPGFQSGRSLSQIYARKSRSAFEPAHRARPSDATPGI